MSFFLIVQEIMITLPPNKLQIPWNVARFVLLKYDRKKHTFLPTNSITLSEK